MIGRSTVDLHTHSLRSDGALEPAELVRRAAANGVRVQALSDHDTLAGIPEAMAAGAALGVRIIPATELNTESEWGDVHVLGYFLDPADGALEDRLRWLRENRGRRVELMVERLRELGYPVSLQRVLELAQGGSLGRPHVASALFEAGHVPSYDAAFDTLIAKGSPAYVERVGLTPLEAVELVRAHGGVPSLAHPGTVVGLEALLPLLVRAGLAGIECHYSYAARRRSRTGTAAHAAVSTSDTHTPEYTEHCLVLASRHGLVPTGGSDFHGRGEHGAEPGGVPVPAETVPLLEARRLPANIASDQGGEGSGEGGLGPTEPQGHREPAKTKSSRDRG